MSSLTDTAVNGLSALRTRGLFSKSVADRLTMAVLIGATLGAMGVWMGPLYLSMRDSLVELAAQLPGATVQIFGDFGSPAGFINAELLSMFGPGLLIYVALTSTSKAFAGEEEDRSIGLLLSSPVSRDRIALQKWAAMLVHTGIVAGATGIGVWLGAVIADLQLPIGNIAAVTVQFWLLGALFGTVAMLLSIVTGRRLASVVATAAIAFVVYVWGAVLPLSESLKPLASWSPWHWFFGVDPLSNGLHVGYTSATAALSLALTAAAVWIFRRRDLAG